MPISIAINRCYGGFSLSDAAVRRWSELWGGQTETYFYDERRANPALIQTIRELGDAANGRHSDIRIVEIPDGVLWEIDEYAGMERVVEKHRTWSA